MASRTSLVKCELFPAGSMGGSGWRSATMGEGSRRASIGASRAAWDSRSSTRWSPKWKALSNSGHRRPERAPELWWKFPFDVLQLLDAPAPGDRYSATRPASLTPSWELTFQGRAHVLSKLGASCAHSFRQAREGAPAQIQVRTGLPAGRYCDIIHDTNPGPACTGPTVVGDSSGFTTVTVSSRDAVAFTRADRTNQN